jgi:methyl-accepting chemotaxis protein
MKISRIQKTILSSYTVIWLIAVALLLGTSRQMLQKRLSERQASQARIVAANVALAVSDPLLIGELDRLKNLVHELKKSDADVAAAWLLDKSGKCVASTDEAKLNQVLGASNNGGTNAMIVQRQASGDLEVSTLVVQGKEVIGALHLVYTSGTVRAMISSMMLIILAVSLGCMVGGLILYTFIINRTIVRRITQVAERLDGNSQATAQVGVQVATSAGDISVGTRQQSAALEETCAALEEMTSMIKRSTESAQSARELGNQSKAAAESGFADVQTMNTAMADIKAASDNIAKIIKTIDEISFQTNLLALNAAVEAARAGEAGAGFAVVADEVRSLAQRCAQSARETATQIEDSIQKSERGVTISGKVAESLQGILAKAREMDTLISEIAQATNEESQAITGINSSVNQIEQALQSAARSTAGFVELSNELREQSEGFQAGMRQLKEIIGEPNPGASSKLLESTGAVPTKAAPTAPPRRTQLDRADQALPRQAAPAKTAAKATSNSKPETVSASFADF